MKEMTAPRAVQRALGYGVHLFTATGAVLGLFALYSIHRAEWVNAFWFMGAAVLIDALDGTFARKVRVSEVTPQVDGSALDLIVDYLNYAVVPAFLMLVGPLLSHGWRAPAASAVLLAAAYQFSQEDAKTEDHYFKGFPSYWNIVVFYLYYWETQPALNAGVIMLLVALSFVPMKYVYPSRLNHLSRSALLRGGFLGATLLWGAALFAMIFFCPARHAWLNAVATGYLPLYFGLSLYRTLRPLPAAQAA